jgi:hypothetical protein
VAATKAPAAKAPAAKAPAAKKPKPAATPAANKAKPSAAPGATQTPKSVERPAVAKPPVVKAAPAAAEVPAAAAVPELPLARRSTAAPADIPTSDVDPSATLAPPPGTEHAFEAASSSEYVQPAELAFDQTLLDRLEEALLPASGNQAGRSKTNAS